MLLGLSIGVVIGIAIGATATWLAVRNRPPRVAPMAERKSAVPAEPPTELRKEAEVEPAPVPEPAPQQPADMGRTAEAMLADLERKFQAIRQAEAEKAAKSKRKPAPSPPEVKRPKKGAG